MTGAEREQLIERMMPLVPRLARMARRRLLTVDLADIKGEGYLALVLAVDDYDPTHPRAASLEHWCSRRIWQGIFNHWRNARWRDTLHQQGVPNTPVESDAEREVAERERRELVRIGLVLCAAKEQRVIRGVLLGWAPRRIAGAMGCSENYVYRLRLRAIRRIRGYVEARNAA